MQQNWFAIIVEGPDTLKVYVIKKHGMPSGSNERNKMNSFRNNKICTYCGKTGHAVEVCYKKHGFPPGFKFSNSRSSANSLVTGDETITNDQTQQIEPK